MRAIGSRAASAAAGLLLVLDRERGGLAQYRESRAHAERTAAVRDFMFDLVNDAEAVEGHEGEVTGRQMVDGAVARARRDFGAQPQLQGELLGELGRMYLRLGAAEAAVPVLAESVAVLEKHAPPDDAGAEQGARCSWPCAAADQRRPASGFARWRRRRVRPAQRLGGLRQGASLCGQYPEPARRDRG